MPTGYTSKIYEGKTKVTLQDFTLGCARAFGALVTMRDDAADAKIPTEFKPSPFYRDKIASEKKCLATTLKWTDKDARREATASYKKEVAAYREIRREHRTLASRYKAMLAEVRKWQPPTPGHDGLKKFMISQLEDSLQHDCYAPTTPVPTPWSVFRDNEILRMQKSIAYYSDEHNKEVDRCRERTIWVRSLLDSFGIKA